MWEHHSTKCPIMNRVINKQQTRNDSGNYGKKKNDTMNDIKRHQPRQQQSTNDEMKWNRESWSKARLLYVHVLDVS